MLGRLRCLKGRGKARPGRCDTGRKYRHGITAQDNPLRIAIFSHDGSLVGGATRSLLNLLDGLKDLGMATMVVCPFRGGLTAALEERGVPYVVIPFKPWLKAHGRAARARALARVAWNLLILPWGIIKVACFKANLVYTNSSATPAGALTAMVLRKPHVWHVRESLRLGVQLSHALGDRVTLWLMNRSRALIAISRFVRETALKGVTAPAYVIRNGLFTQEELGRLNEHRRLDASGGGMVFACIGNLMSSKRQEEAIEALSLVIRKYPEARLMLVGSGEEGYIARLRDLCGKLGLNEVVEFTGYVADPVQAVRMCDAVIVSSRNEGLSRVVIEAMALGKPVIGCRSGGIVELIEDKKNGLLYDNNVASLARCMEMLLEDKGLARRLGESGVEEAREKYTIERYAREVSEVLRRATRTC